jgi:hypothetical protein
MNADGTFSFVPAPGDTGATEVFTYTITDNGLPAPASAVGMVTLNRFERVWYVDPAAGGGGDGTSALPFNTLTPLSGAGGTGDSDLTGDYLFVHDGTLALGAPLPMEASQRLVGQGVGLSIPVNLNGNGSPTNLVAAGAQPQLTNASGDAVTIGAAIPIEIVGLSLASTSGNAIDLTAAAALSGAGTLLIGNNEFRGAGAEGIDVNLNAGTSGTLGLTIQTNTWAAGTHTGNAVDISHAAGAGTLNLAFDSNTGLRSNIHALVIDGGAAASTTITSFANNSVHGDTALTGVQISTATFDATPGGAVQQVNAGTLPIGASGNPVGGPGLRLIAVLGNLLFSDLDIFATSSGLTLTGTAGSTSFNVTPPGSGGSSTIVADAGPAVTVTGAALDLQLADMDSTTASDGVNLNTVSGQFSAPSGSTITKASGGGTGFVVTNSSLTVNYAGTVNVSSGAGVSLTSNTGTMNFTGQLTLNTGANAAFAATGSGTVTATATNSTLTTTTGTALNVANVTIGAGGLNFESISSNGAANGIILNNTGSTAGLTVTGNGNTSVGGDNSGGTIQNATSHGISLTSTSNVSLTNMRILNTSGSGVDGTLVTNFAFLNGRIDNVGTGGGVNTSNIAFNDDAAVTENNLAGAVTITGNVLTNAFYHGVDIFNFDGTLSNATISNNTITSSTSTATSKGSGVRLVAFGSATTVAHVTKATLDNNTISNFPSGAGIVASGGNAGGAPGTFGVPNDATNIIAITNNLIAGNSPANRMSINAIQAVVNGAGQGNFNISNNGTLANPLTNVTGNVIVNSAIGDVTVTSTISNNVIVANHTANVGGALGISAGADSVLPACTIGGTCDNPSFTLTISGNAVSQTDASGIFVRSVNNTGSLTLKVLNNNVAAPLSGFREGIQVHSGSSAGTGNTSVCLEITGNISAGQNGADGIGFRKQGTNSTVHAFAIEGMVATSSPGVETYVHGLNSSADGSADGDALGVTLISATSGFTNCSIP